MRKEETNVGRRALKMDLPWKRRREGPRRKYMEVVNEDMGAMGLGEKDVVDRV